MRTESESLRSGSKLRSIRNTRRCLSRLESHGRGPCGFHPPIAGAGRENP